MNQETWLEMDLYWFQQGDWKDSVPALFDRLVPLWSWAPEARKGLTLCAGWLMDSILAWNGNPDDPIPTCEPPTYQPWTYRRAGALIGEIKAEANRRGIDDFHVALLVLASEHMVIDESLCIGWCGRTDEADERAKYHIRGGWCAKHPEVISRTRPLFRWGAAVQPDASDPVVEDEPLPFWEYLARKTASVSGALNIDGVLFRDGVFTPAYIRGGAKRYADPDERDLLTRHMIDSFQLMKALRPGFLVMGYSSGTSAMEEYRSHGFDLEAVAQSGCLDLWITQTWASAWQDYWPAHSMGYTFQLTSLLVHAAQLAKTPCRHLFLIETFDAWEPFDSIRQYPAKVAWEIWAYSHAAVRLPDGAIKQAAGVYVSWMNRGPELLGTDGVDFLVQNFREAASDLKQQPVPGGPVLVYDRDTLQALTREPTEYSRGEEIDDWSAMLIKYGVPVLSITRTEWLGACEADGFILGPTRALASDAVSSLLQKAEQGVPLLLLGQASAHHARLVEAWEILTESVPVTKKLPSAGLLALHLAEAVGTEAVVLNQRARSLGRGAAWESLIECLSGPVAARHRHRRVVLWETPEWGTPGDLHLSIRSIESPQTYMAIAHEMAREGWGGEAVQWQNNDWTKPAAWLFWRCPGRGLTLLVGNLETGLTGNSQFCIRGEARLTQIAGIETPYALKPTELEWKDNVIYVGLRAYRTALVRVTRSRDT